jgi:cytosine/adenosine deaminase-related metal-dependent hydrolase
MHASLIRGRAMIVPADEGTGFAVIDDGAVVQEDGVIVAVGTGADLRRRYPDIETIGSGRDILLPGFVNAHHHVGLTPLQLGSPDMALELWWVTRMACRAVDPYLDTLYGAFDMISSGITTVQHLHGWVPGALEDVAGVAGQVLQAYDDIGMRVSYAYSVREQNRLVYQADQDFVGGLPADLRAPMQAWFDRFRLSLDDMMDLFASLHASHRGSSRVRIQLAPANLHWCSDTALARIADAAARLDARVHIHLLETQYQKDYARRRTGGSAVEHLRRFGLLGPRTTIGHGVWLTEQDIGLLADTGTCLCHNCSSNFRLRSGLAPLNRFLKAGIPTAIGLDEAGINDDRDMLQEMRLVLRAHRHPGMADDVPTVAQVFAMATRHGATTTGFGDQIGAIAVGRAADLVLLDWAELSTPYLDPLTGVLEAVVQRAKRGAVRTVLCDGEVIYHEGHFTRVDRGAVLRQLQDQLARPLSAEEQARRAFAPALLPHVKAFYVKHWQEEKPKMNTDEHR